MQVRLNMAGKKVIKAALAIAAAAGAIWAVNKFIFKMAGSGNLLDRDHLLKYKWRFGDIAYRKTGKGSPILLVHGLDEGASSYEWQSLAGHLSGNYTVYSIDLPGFGCSSKDTYMYTGYLFVKAIQSFTENVIGGPAVLITSGSASSVGIMAAHGRPDLFVRTVLIHPSLHERGNVTTSDLLMAKLLKLPLLGTFAYVCMEMTPFVAARLKCPASGSDLVRAYREGAYTGGTGARFTGASRICGAFEMNAAKALKDQRGLYIISSANLADRRDVADRFKEICPTAAVRYVPGSSLVPQYDHSQETAGVILTCLEG